MTVSPNSEYFNIPLRETILGDLYFNYQIGYDGYLSYSGLGGTISSYRIDTLNPVSATLGEVSLQLFGNIEYTDTGLSGSVSKITSSASNFLPSETILGNFQMASTDGVSTMDGTLSSYKAFYKDKSYVEIEGSIYLTSDQSVDESMFSLEELWGGDDTFNIELPSTLSTLWYMTSGAGNDIFTVKGGNRYLSIDLGADDDIVNVSDTQSWLNGGDGSDTIISSTIAPNLSLMIDGNFLYYNFENATLQGKSNLNITGNDSSNILT
jgi:hypothetical protein